METPQNRLFPPFLSCGCIIATIYMADLSRVSETPSAARIPASAGDRRTKRTADARMRFIGKVYDGTRDLGSSYRDWVEVYSTPFVFLNISPVR